jgi:hypothetical protein
MGSHRDFDLLTGMITPKEVKSLVKERYIFLVVNEQTTGRVIEIALAADLNMRQRLYQDNHPARINVHSQGAQKPPKQNQVMKELTAFGGGPAVVSCQAVLPYR